MATYLMIPVQVQKAPHAPERIESEADLQVVLGRTPARPGEPTCGNLEKVSSATRCLPLRILPALGEDRPEYVVLQSGRIFTAAEFRHVRLVFGAWILTDEVERLRCLFSLEPHEGGIETEWA